MTFIQSLLELDKELLLKINGLHNSFFNHLMYQMSLGSIWSLLYVAVIFFIIKKWNKDAVWIILVMIICVILTDQATNYIKHLVERLRPTHDPAIKHLIHTVKDYKGGKYGFVSSHAANTMGFAVLTSWIFKNKTYTYLIFFWALLISYSRMYLGVHYPLDVLGGMTVGLISATISILLLKKVFVPRLFLDKTAFTKADQKS